MAEKKESIPDTYAKAGVDLKREDRAIKGIVNWVGKTFQFRKGKIGEVLCNMGQFANLIDLGDYALAFCIDGVGSKVLVAQELGKYDTVGIDCVAMNVNDVICVGAEPISMVDYLALKKTNDSMTKSISKGLYEGAKQADIAIVGGETASLPDIIAGKDTGFDIAAAVIGIVKKENIITGEKVKVGDAVIGFQSSGIHSNGLSLARNVLPKNMWMNILTPTRIYVKEVMKLLKEYEIHGMANITGGGFLNLHRLGKVGYRLDNLPKPQMVFKKIQELGKITDQEMHKTFNMGVGFCMVVSQEDARDIVEKYGKEYQLQKIGDVIKEDKIVIVKDGNEMTLERSLY